MAVVELGATEGAHMLGHLREEVLIHVIGVQDHFTLILMFILLLLFLGRHALGARARQARGPRAMEDPRQPPGPRRLAARCVLGVMFGGVLPRRGVGGFVEVCWGEHGMCWVRLDCLEKGGIPRPGVHASGSCSVRAGCPRTVRADRGCCLLSYSRGAPDAAIRLSEAEARPGPGRRVDRAVEVPRAGLREGPRPQRLCPRALGR
jgi:hypothetical protein